MSFVGTSALITGGASGIGATLGVALKTAGAHVVLADIDPPDDGSCRSLDVRDAAAFDALVDEIGRVDLLINCAGISLGGATHEMSAAHWDRIIDVNVRGVVNGVRAVYPSMIERGSGQIVNVASGAGLAALPFVTAYSMSKHAVVGLSTALRAEASLHGVRVSVLCPGAVDTPILDRLPDPDLPPTDSPPVSPRTFLDLVRQRPIDVDRFAGLALKGIQRDRSIIVVPASMRSLWYLHRLSPSLTGAVAKSLARRVDRTLMSRHR